MSLQLIHTSRVWIFFKPSRTFFNNSGCILNVFKKNLFFFLIEKSRAGTFVFICSWYNRTSWRTSNICKQKKLTTKLILCEPREALNFCFKILSNGTPEKTVFVCKLCSEELAYRRRYHPNAKHVAANTDVSNVSVHISKEVCFSKAFHERWV